MKTQDLIYMAGAALAVYLLYGYLFNKKGGTGAAGESYAKLIQTFAGWQYFTDGTVIGPDGTYYKNGQKITWASGSPIGAEW